MKFESEVVREQARGDSLVLSHISDVTARYPRRVQKATSITDGSSVGQDLKLNYHQMTVDELSV
jgi:hypothetical protein